MIKNNSTFLHHSHRSLSPLRTTYYKRPNQSNRFRSQSFCLSVLRQVRPLKGEPEAARAQTHRRTSVRVPVLRPSLWRQIRSDAPSTHPYRRAAVPLRGVRQVFRARRLSVQTSDDARAQFAALMRRGVAPTADHHRG